MCMCLKNETTSTLETYGFMCLFFLWIPQFVYTWTGNHCSELTDRIMNLLKFIFLILKLQNLQYSISRREKKKKTWHCNVEKNRSREILAKYKTKVQILSNYWSNSKYWIHFVCKVMIIHSNHIYLSIYTLIVLF